MQFSPSNWIFIILALLLSGFVKVASGKPRPLHIPVSLARILR